MIEFSLEEKKVRVKITSTIGLGWAWLVTVNECEAKPYAILLKDRLEKDMSNKLEAIRREAYNEGWKDAKSKKVAKKTWFKSWW